MWLLNHTISVRFYFGITLEECVIQFWRTVQIFLKFNIFFLTDYYF